VAAISYNWRMTTPPPPSNTTEPELRRPADSVEKELLVERYRSQLDNQNPEPVLQSAVVTASRPDSRCQSLGAPAPTVAT